MTFSSTFNPLIKITFECDLSETDVNFYLSSDIHLEIGNWQMAVDTIAFDYVKPQDDTKDRCFNFDIRCSLVKDLQRVEGKYVLQYTSLNRFSYVHAKKVKVINNGDLRWFLINNYQSEHINFYLSLWPEMVSKDLRNLFPKGAATLSVQILLKRIN